MTTRFFALALGLLLLSTLQSFCTDNTYVRFSTNLGNIDVLLLTDEAPNTVQNFLNYVNGGKYTNSIIHRSVQAFVIQGGGFNFVNSTLTAIPANAAIASEAGVSNIRGTLAMALSTGANSATNQWFFNDVDNSALLDGTADGGPFTVFGRIANTSSLSVMDQINNLQVFAFNSPFDSLPLINYTTANFNASVSPPIADFVTINSITPLTVQNFTAWQTAKFTAPQQAQPTFIAPASIPLNDGVPNLLKYVFDINPSVPMTSAGRGNLPVVGTTTISGTKYLTVTYHQYTKLAGVTVNVQTSPDLQTWTTLTNPTIVQTGTDSSSDPIMQVQVPESGTIQFVRLNVTQP